MISILGISLSALLAIGRAAYSNITLGRLYKIKASDIQGS
jgi:hypothetical protein